MASAFGWGLVAASSLVLGGLVGVRVRLSDRMLGLIMAFGAGVLISAVAYDLIEEAFDTASGFGGVGLGFAAGALAFYAGDAYVDRMGGDGRKRSGGGQAAGSALAIVLGIVLDGIPESIVIGLSLIGGAGVGVTVLAAVFLSNLPEAIAATTGLRAGGWPSRRILALWAGVALVSAVASLTGYAAFDGASPNAVAFVVALGGARSS